MWASNRRAHVYTDNPRIHAEDGSAFPSKEDTLPKEKTVEARRRHVSLGAQELAYQENPYMPREASVSAGILTRAIDKEDILTTSG